MDVYDRGRIGEAEARCRKFIRTRYEAWESDRPSPDAFAT